MSLPEKPAQNGGSEAEPESRAERLRRELRANLAKRKAQKRARVETGPKQEDLPSKP